jgi:hypothetical protein
MLWHVLLGGGGICVIYFFVEILSEGLLLELRRRLAVRGGGGWVVRWMRLAWIIEGKGGQGPALHPLHMSSYVDFGIL